MCVDTFFVDNIIVVEDNNKSPLLSSSPQDNNKKSIDNRVRIDSSQSILKQLLKPKRFKRKVIYNFSFLFVFPFLLLFFNNHHSNLQFPSLFIFCIQTYALHFILAGNFFTQKKCHLVSCTALVRISLFAN
jgi:hypothetical protein